MEFGKHNNLWPKGVKLQEVSRGFLMSDLARDDDGSHDMTNEAAQR